jgi:L-aspartate oxidase
MTAHAGVVRDAISLAEAERQLGAASSALDASDDHRSAWEARNLLAVGAALVAAACAREESRGCHTRTDFPDTDPALARRLVIRSGGRPPQAASR